MSTSSATAPIQIDKEEIWDTLSDLLDDDLTHHESISSSHAKDIFLIPESPTLPIDELTMPGISELIQSNINVSTESQTIEDESILNDNEMEMALVLLHMANQTVKKKRNQTTNLHYEKPVTRSTTIAQRVIRNKTTRNVTSK